VINIRCMRVYRLPIGVLSWVCIFGGDVRELPIHSNSTIFCPSCMSAPRDICVRPSAGVQQWHLEASRTDVCEDYDNKMRVHTCRERTAA
jgi:hypothetical protein